MSTRTIAIALCRSLLPAVVLILLKVEVEGHYSLNPLYVGIWTLAGAAALLLISVVCSYALQAALLVRDAVETTRRKTERPLPPLQHND